MDPPEPHVHTEPRSELTVPLAWHMGGSVGLFFAGVSGISDGDNLKSEMFTLQILILVRSEIPQTSLG